MGSAVAAIPSSLVQESFEELERQRELITSCTLLWKELSDHFSSLERDLQLKSESLRSKRQSLDLSTQRSLASLHRRELSIDGAVDLALAKVDERCDAALLAISSPTSPLDSNNDNDLSGKLRSFCTRMDRDAFWDLVISKREEVELLRSELPLALADCINPPKFVMDAISIGF